ncbi:MAG: hypothetical protein O2856_19265 [Planctomycetota bacterium]|nr:hypothetical protein [Planctomycetota bacterium]
MIKRCANLSSLPASGTNQHPASRRFARPGKPGGECLAAQKKSDTYRTSDPEPGKSIICGDAEDSSAKHSFVQNFLLDVESKSCYTGKPIQ